MTPEEEAVATRVAAYVTRLRRAGPVGFVPDTENRDAGYPFYRAAHGRYTYAAYERGEPVSSQETTDLDEIVWWILRDITFSMAVEWELHHRRTRNWDWHAQLWARHEALAEGLEPAWGERIRAEHAQMRE